MDRAEMTRMQSGHQLAPYAETMAIFYVRIRFDSSLGTDKQGKMQASGVCRCTVVC